MAAPEQTLEALVREELRGPVAELVRRLVHELVAEQMNGAIASAPATARNGAAIKVCTGCGEQKPVSEFEQHRNRCKECRRGRARGPAEPPSKEPPRAARSRVGTACATAASTSGSWPRSAAA